MPDNRKFPLTIAPLWESKFGGYYTYLKPEHFDNLQKVGQTGMIQIKIAKSRKDERSPHAYLEYLTEEEVAANRVAQAAKTAGDTPTEESL